MGVKSIDTNLMDSKRSVPMDSNYREFGGFELDGGKAILLSTVLSVMDSKVDVTDRLEHHPFDGYEPCSFSMDTKSSDEHKTDGCEGLP